MKDGSLFAPYFGTFVVVSGVKTAPQGGVVMRAGSVPMRGAGPGPYVAKTICNGNQRHRLGQRGMPIVLLTHIPETR